MSSQPHDKTGKKCSRCPKIFTAQSMTMTISTREEGFIVKHLVCGNCYHKHFKQGE